MTPEIVHRGNNLLGESPVWCWRSGRLLWTDIRASRIHALTPGTGAVETVIAPDLVAALALDGDDGLILAMRKGVGFYRPGSGFREAAAVEPDRPANRSNEGRCDRQGRFWLGTLDDTAREPNGAFYRYDRRGLSRMLAGITIPNCLAWSPDGRIMYFADSWTGAVMAYDYDIDDGAPSNPRVLLAAGALPGMPDGATVDEAGCLWHARYGGGQVARIAPDGRVDAVIALPAGQVSACALGGDDLKTLYVTSARQRMSEDALAREPEAGALFSVVVPTAGVREPLFRPDRG